MSMTTMIGRPVGWLAAVMVAATLALLPATSATAAAATGTLSGRVAFADQPWDGTPWRIDAQPVTDGALASTEVAGDGTYRLSLVPGTYRVRAVPIGEHTGIPPFYLGGTLRPDEAAVVTVTAGQELAGQEIRRFTGEDVPRRASAEWRPFIKGTPRVGWALTVDPQRWTVEDDWFGQPLPVSDAEGQGDLFTFQWYAGNRAIAGATGRTFTPTWRQLGQRLTVRVGLDFPNLTVTNGTTLATSRVVLGRNRPCKAPAVAGSARVGQRLHVTSTCWNAAKTTTRSTWFVNGHRLGTGRALRVGHRLRGDRVSVVVTAKAKGYATQRVRTNSVRIR